MILCRTLLVALAVCAAACQQPVGAAAQNASDVARSESRPAEPTQPVCRWFSLNRRYYFPSASSELQLNAASRETFAMTADEYRRGVLLRVVVQGYVAAECPAERSLLPDLAMDRARAVAAHLVEIGIPADRIQTRADIATSLPTPTYPEFCGPETPNSSRQAELVGLLCRSTLAVREGRPTTPR